MGIERLPPLRRPLEGAAVLGRLNWRVATVAEVRTETPRVTTLVLDVPDWEGHRAGQHVDVRLTAPDGYQAQRSYSIASASEPGRVALTVERVDDGEVSPWLTEIAAPGDVFELRGPVGGYFVWDGDLDGAAFLVAGGSGIVPLMAMARQRAADDDRVSTTLLFSVRSWEDAIYRDDLAALEGDGFRVVYTLTRSQPEGWSGYARRVDASMLDDVAPPDTALSFVCGPTPFVETVARTLVQLGHRSSRIKTERFGPTGG